MAHQYMAKIFLCPQKNPLAPLLNMVPYQRVFLFAVHLPKGVFVDRKILGLMPMYYLLAEDTSQVSIFFLTSDKNE